MRLLLTCFLAFTLTAVSAQSGYRWYKGNTHTHSYWSDGDDFPEMIMDWYKSHGYHFISLSDHNTLAAGEKWKLIPAAPFRQRRFQEYLAKYGRDWVVHRTDSAGRIHVRLKTLAEYAPRFEEPGTFLIMPAEEITDKFGKKDIHLGAVNIRELIKPQGGRSVAEMMQRNLDAVQAQRQQTGQPMIAHINHPNFTWSVSVDDMLQLKGERFFEVYNGHPHVHNYGDSTTLGMEELWDRLLVHYLQTGQPLVYGLATDDAHHFLENRIGLANPGRGWIMVRARELTPAAIIGAMEKGDFYATTGVELRTLTQEKGQLRVAVKPERRVTYTIQFWGARRDGQGGRMLKEVRGKAASYALTDELLYVRAKIISSKPKANPYQAGDLETAWTQPVSLK